MRTLPIVLTAAVALAGCASPPRQTLGELNIRDPQYTSRECRDARREAAQFDENRNGRTVVALAGNLLVPFAGTAAAAAMTKLRDDTKRDLNKKLRAACTSDPLAKKRVARR
jgi:hypothetical protein